MNLREAAQQSLEALENLDEQELASGDMVWLGKEIGDLRVALEPVTACHELSKEGDKLSPPFNHFADAGKMVDDTPEQKMLRKKWFGGRLYGHLPFLEAVDETMKSLYDKLDEAQGTWKMLDNHFADVSKMVATIRPEVTVEPVAWTTKGQIYAMENGFQHYIHGRVPRFVSPTEDDVPLYTAPPKRKPLTDEELFKLGAESHEDIAYARAIERAHRIGGEE